MSPAQLPKGYEPEEAEARWQSHWEENKTFTPDPDAPGEPYSIVIPPPNVTGQLHMGHALNITLQDILCRFHRQKGCKVLWVPGTDHAGIATQNVVERKLKTEGKTRDDLGREKFIERVWEWREDYGSRILNQIRRLGASVDWTRERFTMDEGLSKAVREVFVRLYDEGLIYKGNYIINWCNRCHTALADDEVEHAPRKGALHEIKYKLKEPVGDLDGLIVATTRPETMLGDTAVAVHPEDERYQAVIGKTVILPLVNREIPVIADNYVDREFGTGCLKVTPAHDMNDWALGKKHDLEVIQVIDDKGLMNANAGAAYQGMTKEDCRKKVLDDLKELGLLIKIEEYEHNVGHCYRCKSVIEPHVSPQWFVAVKPLAEKARAAVPEATQILPEQWVKVYYNWLDNIRDWCISRQIWWGHRIPAWECKDCGEYTVSIDTPTACKSCGSANLVQEEDVLDTWFSSALWPFSTMGWPDKTKELETFYPTSVLLTGFDIIFFWVARMMMMGIHFMGEIPFKDVYIHALVRDGEGKKMSKSTGNVIDPVEMIDKFGTDSLRFTLTAFAAMGRDIKLSEDRIEGYRHFVNKIWNAARFTLMQLPEELPDVAAYPLDKDDGIHHAWLFHRLEELKEQIETALSNYYFNEAAQSLYRFTWHEFCDWYLELIKPELYGENPEQKAMCQVRLWTALKELLTLMHPIMPFVTQEIWSHLPGITNPDLALEPFPTLRPGCLKPKAAEEMALIQEGVVAVRNIRGELNINPSLELELLIRPKTDTDRTSFETNRDLISNLARLKSITIDASVTPPKASASAVVQGNELFVPLTGAVNFDDELARLDKELNKIEKDLTAVNKKLMNRGFTSKAPEEVVQKERDRAAALDEKQGKLLELQARLKAAME